MNINKKIIIFCIAVLLLSLCFLISCQNKSNLSNIIPGSYFLENATQKEIFAKLLSVTLYDDGTVNLATPPISSYALVEPCKYTIENGELSVRFENSGDVIAVFTVADDNALIFKGASVPLYADAGTRYVYTPQWISFDLDKNKITLYAENIPGIDIFQVINGESERWDVTDINEIDLFAEWVNNFILEKAVFENGHTPGEKESEYGYIFRTSFGGKLFEYDMYDSGEFYVYIGGEWYLVKNPSIMPLVKP